MSKPCVKGYSQYCNEVSTTLRRKDGWREDVRQEIMERWDRKKSTAHQRGKRIADEIQITFTLLVMKPGWGEGGRAKEHVRGKK